MIITVFTRTRHRSLSWARWNQYTPTNPISSDIFYVHIILPSTPFSSKWLLSIRISNQNRVRTSSLCYARSMPRSSRHHWFDHASNEWWRLQITELLIKQCSPSTSTVFLVGPNVLAGTLFCNTPTLDTRFNTNTKQNRTAIRNIVLFIFIGYVAKKEPG
jgi:hypothetical protein